nr:hypothetical protein [uncultured Marinobacter sp.]
MSFTPLRSVKATGALGVKFKVLMNYSLIISGISALIACGALWVSHRNHLATAKLKRRDRQRVIRLGACELNTRASSLLGKFALIESVLPAAQKSKPVKERYAGLLAITENLDALIIKTATDAPDAELDDMEVSLQKVLGAVRESEEQADLILGRI